MAKKMTEGDLEARMHAVIEAAFPWLPANAISHQTHFSVKLGHTTVQLDGNRRGLLSGRSDILVSAQGSPLVLLELKREGLPLTRDDVDQGLSYARLTTPITPLVIVSNGKDTSIYVTLSGDEWSPADRTEEALHRSLNIITKIAEADLRNAINTLMGTDQHRWVKALQSVSERLIAERTGNWADLAVPFVHDFLIPRGATAQIIEAIRQETCAIVVFGPPLSGKSNVLRELCEKMNETESDAILMMEPNETGVFVAVSHILSNELGWKLSSDDAREWLRNISNGGGSTLILALDDADPTSAPLRSDLNELVSTKYGPNLRLVVTVDESALEALIKKNTGREATPFGRSAKVIPLHPLDDIEFKHAQHVLRQHRIHLTHGGESVLSLREPWILRALVPAENLLDLPVDSPHLVVHLPPLMDIEALQQAANSIVINAETNVALRITASAILEQYLDVNNPEVILQGLSTFAIDKRHLENALGDSLQELRQRGFLKLGINLAEQPVWFVRVPTLIAKHIAIVLAEQIGKWGAMDHTAQRLIVVASKMPLGDLIAAYALVLYIKQGRGNDFLGLVSALLQKSPEATSLSTGTKIIFSDESHIFRGTVLEGGKLAVSAGASVMVIDLGVDALADAMIDLGGWLILSHLAAVPLGVCIQGEADPARLDEPLLLNVGQAKLVLSRPDGSQDFKEVAVHDINGHGSIVCHLSGVVEPITWALVKYFIVRGLDATAWIEEAIATKSLPLMARMYIALHQVAKLSDARGKWARKMLSEQLNPALAVSKMHH